MANHIVLIGSGPGGYTAAIRAAQLGAQVTLIEKDALGGTCVNRGCIPTKALLQSADVFTQTKNAATLGIMAKQVSLDFSVVANRKKTLVQQMVDGIAYLMKKNKIEVINGTGTLLDARTVQILGADRQISADNIVIATGSKPARVPIPGADEPNVMTSDEALALEQLPGSIIIIGGGVVGLEFAQILSTMGTKVTIVEMMPQILPGEDSEIASMLTEVLKQEGVEIFTDATVTSIDNAEGQGKAVSFTTKTGQQEEKKVAEKVLLAVGRSPNTDDLGIDKLGLATDRGKLVVNEWMESNVPGVYAIGDVVGRLMFAHVAMEEGKHAVENSLGAQHKIDYDAVPRCVYTSPEMGTVGLTEAQAKERYGDIKVGRFPLSVNAKARIANAAAGIVKIIADANYGQILGVHIVGPHATELIAEAVLGIRMEATTEDIAATIHAHPTLSEAILEADLAAEGRAINF